MTTRIYGASDDLVEFGGDVSGECNGGSFDIDAKEPGMIFCSDGTVLTVVYGDTQGRGIWKLTLVERGSLLDRIDICTSEDDDPYSDVAHFKDGLEWAYVAKSAERAS